MNIKILKLSAVDFNNITFLYPSQNTVSNVVIPVSYRDNGNKLFIINVPSLLLTNKYKNANSDLIFPFVGKTEQTTKESCEFFKKLDDLVMKNIKELVNRYKLSKKMPFDKKKIFYKGLINEVDNDDDQLYKNGLLRFKMHDYTKVYDENKTLIPKNEYETRLVSGTYIKFILEISNVTITNNNNSIDISITANVHQMALSNEYPRKVVLNDYAFVDSDKEPTICNNVVTSNQKSAEPTLHNNGVTSNQRFAEPNVKPLTNTVNKPEPPKVEMPKPENKLEKQTAVLNNFKASNKIDKLPILSATSTMGPIGLLDENSDDDKILDGVDDEDEADDHEIAAVANSDDGDIAELIDHD